MFKFKRRLEILYTHSQYIAEFWNTVSNIPFIVMGLLRLYEGTTLVGLYQLLIASGIASGIHHATTHEWTILIDWAPIAGAIILLFNMGVLHLVSYATWFGVAIALGILYSDHVHHLMPVPWGHATWHLLATLAIDGLYQNIEHK